MTTLGQQANFVRAARMNKDTAYIKCCMEETEKNLKGFFDAYKEYNKQRDLFTQMYNDDKRGG